MLNIKSVLEAILKDLKEKPENIEIIDDEHFIDKLSGVKFHLYDDYFQMTRGNEKPVGASSFSPAEQQLIMTIKDVITDPAVSADKKMNYKRHIEERRQRFSNWFENPQPVQDGVKEEHDTEEYIR